MPSLPTEVSLADQLIGHWTLDFVWTLFDLPYPIDLLWKDPVFARFGKCIGSLEPLHVLRGKGCGGVRW